MVEKLSNTIAGEICLSKDPGGSMKKWREIFGITQTELADKLHITSSTISDYEGGRRKSPGIVVVARFVQTLVEIDSGDRKSTRLNSSHIPLSRMPSSA